MAFDRFALGLLGRFLVLRWGLVLVGRFDFVGRLVFHLGLYLAVLGRLCRGSLLCHRLYLYYRLVAAPVAPAVFVLV